MRETFAELTEDLLDLTVVEKGVGNAIFAADDPGGASSSCTYCSSLCCFHICW
jgi:hypothetical protein